MAFSMKGVLSFTLLLTTVYFYSAVFTIPAIVVLPFSIKYSSRICELLYYAPFTGFFVAVVELLFGVKIVITGDVKEKLSSSRPTLIIANHSSRIDWFFTWFLTLRIGSLRKQRAVSIGWFRDAPIVGWAFSLAMLIFVKRNWQEDRKNIRNVIGYYKDIDLPVQLVLFPEGRFLNEVNLKKDHDFASMNSLEQYEYILHPRTKGFIECVNSLRESFGEFDICNVTTGYVGNISHAGIETIQGGIPTEIHFHVEKVSGAEFASLSDDGLEKWVQDRWRDKEHRLKDFYQNKSFHQPATYSSTLWKDDWMVYVNLIGYIIYCLFGYVVFVYYLPWTILIVALFAIVSLCVQKRNGGWSRLILNLKEG